MLELFNGLTDDQKAVIGCALSLGVCGATMWVSYYLGHRIHSAPEHESSAEAQPAPSSAALSAARTSTVQASRRNAA